MMIRSFLALVLIAACTADASDPTDTVTGPQDLSGYATLEDLAALQEQVDAQAVELDELRTIVEERAAEAVTQASATCTSEATGPFATFTFADHIHVVQISVCQQADGSTRCYGPDPTGIGLYSYHRYDTAQDGVLSDMQVACDAASDVVWVAYIVTD